MAEVCKGNVYLTISKDEIDKYLSKGFSLIDEKTGKIIKQSIPTEVGPLQKLYEEQLAINKKLTDEIVVLRNKIESLQQVESVTQTDSTPEDSDPWSDWTEETTATSKKKKPKSK